MTKRNILCGTKRMDLFRQLFGEALTTGRVDAEKSIKWIKETLPRRCDEIIGQIQKEMGQRGINC